MRLRRRFGRWAEAAVARAFRDRQYEVLTAEGMNRMPLRDMEIRKHGIEIDIQVKGTARLKPTDGFEYDWGNLRDYITMAKERDKRWALVVCNVRKRLIYVFIDQIVEEYVVSAERGIGDAYSRPGRILLEYENATRTYDLTTAEIAEGKRIAEDDPEPSSDLFADIFKE